MAMPIESRGNWMGNLHEPAVLLASATDRPVCQILIAHTHYLCRSIMMEGRPLKGAAASCAIPCLESLARFPFFHLLLHKERRKKTP
jgi:hypothetical protein